MKRQDKVIKKKREIINNKDNPRRVYITASLDMDFEITLLKMFKERILL